MVISLKITTFAYLTKSSIYGNDYSIIINEI